MKKKISKKLKRRKQRIQYRLRDINWKERNKPMFSAGNIHYEIADRTRGLAYGGIGGMLVLARQTGLVKAIDDKLKLLKRHLPYYESDHVLNIAYNILCNGDCLENIERLRNDEVYLDALGAQRIPDPTTAGDICRPFENFGNEKDMTQRQLEAMDLTSQSAGTRKLCLSKIIAYIALERREPACFEPKIIEYSIRQINKNETLYHI